MSQAYSPGKSRCLGNLIFPITLSQGTRERESGIKACGNGKKKKNSDYMKSRKEPLPNVYS